MIHAETDPCIAALGLDATSAVESKMFLAEILPSPTAAGIWAWPLSRPREAGV